MSCINVLDGGTAMVKGGRARGELAQDKSKLLSDKPFGFVSDSPDLFTGFVVKTHHSFALIFLR